MSKLFYLLYLSYYRRWLRKLALLSIFIVCAHQMKRIITRKTANLFRMARHGQQFAKFICLRNIVKYFPTFFFSKIQNIHQFIHQTGFLFVWIVDWLNSLDANLFVTTPIRNQCLLFEYQLMTKAFVVSHGVHKLECFIFFRSVVFCCIAFLSVSFNSVALSRARYCVRSVCLNDTPAFRRA